MFTKLINNCPPGSRLAHRARLLHTEFLISTDDDDYLITIAAGAVRAVTRGPLVMPSYDFSLASSTAEWRRFLQHTPPPGSHDIMAMLRRHELKLAGNLHPLMSNLMYFKLLLASLRNDGPTT